MFLLTAHIVIISIFMTQTSGRITVLMMAGGDMIHYLS